MFNKAYVINLRRRVDRKTHINKELEKTKLDYIFWEAVDGQDEEHLENYEVNIMKDWKDPYNSKAMTRGEVGCGLSHYSIWKDIVDNSDKTKLNIIFEDDIILHDNFDELLDKYIDELNGAVESYDMIYLGRKPIRRQNEKKVSEHFVKPNYSYWTNAYILTWEGAKKLVDSNYLQNMIPADEFMSLMIDAFPYDKFKVHYENCEKLNCYSVSPLLVHLRVNAFHDSDTYNSDPYDTKDVYYFNNDKKFLVLSVGTDETDGLKRFIKYCNLYGVPHKILGLDKEWKGGNMSAGQGGGQKINLLKNELSSWTKEDLESTVILFTDSYDVLVVAPPEEIVEKYIKFVGQYDSDKVIFSAEKFCWPDTSLAKEYPDVDSNYKYLNSGGFVGYANKVLDLINNTNIKDTDDDQLFYTRKLLEGDDIVLDNNCKIFQTLNGVGEDISINYKTSRIRNVVFNTNPCFFHGNGPLSVKLYLNCLENYTGDGWNHFYKNNKTYKYITKTSLIYVAVFLEGKSTKCLEIFDKVKDNLIINIYTTNKNLSESELEDKYNIHYDQNMNNLYNTSIISFLGTSAKYYFHMEDNYILTEPQIFQDLMNLDKGIVGPLVKKRGQAWSNFWGAIGNKGYYKRSFDYMDIVNGIKKGCWNVPYLTGVYMMKRDIVQQYPNMYFKDNNVKDIDMRFCNNMRKKGIFMYVENNKEYGYIHEEVNIYSLHDNKAAWEQKYLHPEYLANKKNLKELRCTEPITDLFNFPIFSDAFCEELIEECEKKNEWSKGGMQAYEDKRLGGIENVPTVDTHLNQIGFEKQWETILMDYVRPMVRHLYYGHSIKRTHLAFVVRYLPEEQCELKPHHDSSIVTLNIALNRGGGVDYEGGGSYFIKQDHTSIDQEIGTCNTHPGRLSHYHSGLKTTGGKRYILVVFTR